MLTEVNYVDGGGGGKSAVGFEQSVPSNKRIECGFKPKKFLVSFIMTINSQVTTYLCSYDAEVSENTYTLQHDYNNTKTVLYNESITSGNPIQLVDAKGITISNDAESNLSYIVIG